jgi:signal transduction histidine kinase
MQQVLLNIIQNARYALNEKYPGSHKDKVIDISLLKSYVKGMPYAEIRIHDHGSGIDDKYIGKVMEPFFTTKSATHGTGLGLSICNNIVSSHNGLINVQSQKGHFTRVSVSLPSEE